ncbi:hypothetical protein JCM10213v2_006548 [Rhodosporidiobolus nylandii]
MLRPVALAGAPALALAVSAAAFPAAETTLAPRYDHSAIGSTTSTTERDGLAKYGTLIAIHALCAFFAFQVFMPLAVVVAAVGKSAFPEHWFKAHWKMQLFVVLPLALMGFALIGVLFLQAFVGWYAHHRQMTVGRFAAENGRPEPAPKRRAANWLHIGIGITVLTLGGLQVTWGFDEYEEHLGKSVPTWVEVVHYVIAGIPVVIVTPFILVRGVMRMRDGYSFAAAFFSRPAKPQPYQPPPRKLMLGSNYIDEAYGPSGIVFDEDAEKEGVGHEYAKGQGADGRMRVESYASSWPGAETREEYEREILSQRGEGSAVGSFASHSTALYDYAQHGEEEASSLLRSAAAMGQETPSPAPSVFHPSQAVPTQVSYPPTSSTSSGPPHSLPPMSPVFHSTSPSPSTLIASAAPATPAPPASSAVSSTFSPRLSFMPFPGPDAILPPRGPNDSPAYASTLSSSSTLSRQPVAGGEPVVRLPLPGEGEASDPALLIPSPPPPGPSPSIYSEPSYRPFSVSTSEAALCDGEARTAEPTVSPVVQRHQSLAGRIETARPQRQETIREETVSEVNEAAAEQAAQSSASSLESEVLPTDKQEQDNDEDVPLADDAESTRLMDELERELTISTMRSGRSRAAPKDDDGEGVENEEVEAQTEVSVDEQTKLQREQSGKWFGGAKER